jgi:hypothetical protein
MKTYIITAHRPQIYTSKYLCNEKKNRRKSIGFLKPIDLRRETGPGNFLPYVVDLRTMGHQNGPPLMSERTVRTCSTTNPGT